MADEKDIEDLKTELAGLKVRIRRIEDYLLTFSNPEDYIHQASSEVSLFEEAVKVVCQYDRASASLLQRKLSIGYARAARLLDKLEEAGVLGSGEGAKPRDVLIKNPDKLNVKK